MVETTALIALRHALTRKQFGYPVAGLEPALAVIGLQVIGVLHVLLLLHAMPHNAAARSNNVL